MCACMYVCMHACMHACMYIHVRPIGPELGRKRAHEDVVAARAREASVVLQTIVNFRACGPEFRLYEQILGPKLLFMTFFDMT